MKNTKQLSALSIAAAFIGTVVGAGFATGQEVLQFFSFFGRNSVKGIIIATFLFCYFGLVIMKISREQKADSHLELVRFAFGRKLGIFMDWFIILSFIGVLIIMAAGSAAVAEEKLGLPPLLGSIIVILLSFLTVISGVRNVIKAIGFVVPIMLFSVLGVAIFSILHDPLTSDKMMMLESLHSSMLTDWSFAALLYVSCNLLLAVAILAPLGAEAQNNKSIILGGILGGLGLGIGILAINLAILSSIPEILPFQVPMLFLATRFHPLLGYVYGIILLLEVYTTAVSVLYGFVARISYTKMHQFLWAGLASVGAILASQLGFSKLIITVYPLFGFIGLIFLAGLAWTQLRDPLFNLFRHFRFQRK